MNVEKTYISILSLRKGYILMRKNKFGLLIFKVYDE